MDEVGPAHRDEDRLAIADGVADSKRESIPPPLGASIQAIVSQAKNEGSPEARDRPTAMRRGFRTIYLEVEGANRDAAN